MRQKWFFTWRGGVALFAGFLFLLLAWRTLLSSDDFLGDGAYALGHHGHEHGLGDGHDHGLGHGHEHKQAGVQPYDQAREQPGKKVSGRAGGAAGGAGASAGAKMDVKLGGGTGGGSGTGGRGGREGAPGPMSEGKRAGPRRRVPLIFHQIFRDENLPAPYMMALTALLRHHRIRDPNKAQSASATAEDADPEFDYHFWTDQAVRPHLFICLSLSLSLSLSHTHTHTPSESYSYQNILLVVAIS